MKRLIALASIGIAALTGCGGGSNDTVPTIDADASVAEWVAAVNAAEGEPVTFEQASVLALSLRTSAELADANFRIVLPGDNGGFELAAGTVNFPNIEGTITSGTLLGDNHSAGWDEEGVYIIEETALPPQDATPDETARYVTYIGALMKLAATQADNPVLVQQNGALVLTTTDTTFTAAIEGNRDAVLEVDSTTGEIQRAMLRLADPMLPNGNTQVVFDLDFNDD